jgi:hypothetical protein
MGRADAEYAELHNAELTWARVAKEPSPAWRLAVLLGGMLEVCRERMHPLRVRAFEGRIDAGIGYYLARCGDSDARGVAELRSRRWPGYHNRSYRKRARRDRSRIMLAMSMRW